MRRKWLVVLPKVLNYFKRFKISIIKARMKTTTLDTITDVLVVGEWFCIFIFNSNRQRRIGIAEAETRSWITL